MRIFIVFIIFYYSIIGGQAQSISELNEESDSLYILEFEGIDQCTKVLHAEPLFIDLIRDLGARKGEKEWNVGIGLTDKGSYDLYSTLIEYEWAPLDRLGLEVELPFSIYRPITNTEPIPKSKLNSLKLAAQYTFLVSDRHNMSLALGYIHEFKIADFAAWGKENFFIGHLKNPFFVAAKRWGNNYHSLVYAGPMFYQRFPDQSTNYVFQMNSNFHYMISGTRNFVGLEVNKLIEPNDLSVVFRPQMRVGIADNLLVGLVTEIPASRNTDRFGSFIRLIYEPGHRLGSNNRNMTNYH